MDTNEKGGDIMAKSRINRGGGKAGNRGGGNRGGGGQGAGLPSKTGKPSGRGRYNAPPKRK